jgi:3-hydroxyisobutyrate dehydrogenase
LTVSTQRIGFIGLGNMGGRMTRRLVAAGHPVLGFDPVGGRAEAAGATAATSVAAVVAGCDIVLLSLPDSSVVEKVVRGEDGILAAGRPGQVVVDLSTASPSSSMALHLELAAREIEFLDAGISGGASGAETGTLTIMVGGSAATLDKIGWVLQPIAAKVAHMGEPGAGHLTKVLNNFLNAVSLAATAEVMLTAKKGGLDLDQVLDVINSSSGVNFATLNRFPHIVHGDYLEGGLTGALMIKDINLYIACAGELGVPSLTSAGPLAAFGLANSLGYRDQISNRVVDAIGDLAGGIRLHDKATSAG